MVCDRGRPDNGQPAPIDDYFRAEDIGLSGGELRAAYPWAAELVALDGTPCWSADDLAVAE
jgi:hypothetical protein